MNIPNALEDSTSYVSRLFNKLFHFSGEKGAMFAKYIKLRSEEVSPLVFREKRIEGDLNVKYL